MARRYRPCAWPPCLARVRWPLVYCPPENRCEGEDAYIAALERMGAA